MSVFGLMGLGRAGQTAGSSLGEALKEIFKLKYAEQLQKQRAQEEFQRQLELTKQNFLNQLALQYAGAGNRMLMQYAPYMTPEQIKQFETGLTTGVTSGKPDQMIGSIVDLFSSTVRAANKAKQETDLDKFRASVAKFAKETKPEAINEAYKRWQAGDQSWFQPLAVGAAEAAAIERDINLGLKKAQTEATQAQAGLTEARTQEVQSMLPWKLKLIASEVDMNKTRVKIGEKDILLKDLLAERQKLENELMRETNPLKVQELKKRIELMDAQAQLDLARKALIGQQTEGQKIQNEQRKKLWGATLTSTILETAMNDASAGEELLSMYKDELKNAGADPAKLEKTIKRFNDVQRRMSPEAKAAFAAVDFSLNNPPPKNEWDARAEQIAQKIVQATGDQALGETWKAILKDAWAGKLNDRQLELMKLSLRARVAQGSGPDAYKTYLDMVKEMRSQLNDTAKNLEREINATAKELNASGCVTIVGNIVRISNEGDCAQVYDKVSKQIGNLKRVYEGVMTKLGDLYTYTSMLDVMAERGVNPRAYLDTQNRSRSEEAAKEMLSQMINDFVKQNGYITDADIQAIAAEVASKTGVSIKGVNRNKLKQLLGDKYKTPEELQQMQQSVSPFRSLP